MPWRTIWAAIVAVLVTYVLLQLIRELARIISWLVMAGFLAAVLTPPVDLIERKLRIRRGFAIAIVVVATFVALSAMMTAFIVPIVREGQQFVEDLPGFVEDAQAGRGTIGELIDRYNLEELVRDNQDRLSDFASDLGSRSFGVLRGIFIGVAALLTILVLTILMVGSGPRLSQAGLALIPEEHRDRARAVGGDAARAVSGYVFGNLLISAVAGLATWIVLSALGVPYAAVLALWVAFADLIPMIGATLGAIPTIAFAFLHTTPAGIVALLFYIAYQQFENHVLQPQIMSRTVNVSPLAVLVAALCGIELAGFAGALLAIPAASVIAVIVRDVYDWRRGELKLAPTVGVAEKPVGVPRPTGLRGLLHRLRSSRGRLDAPPAVPADPPEPD